MSARSTFTHVGYLLITLIGVWLVVSCGSQKKHLPPELPSPTLPDTVSTSIADSLETAAATVDTLLMEIDSLPTNADRSDSIASNREEPDSIAQDSLIDTLETTDVELFRLEAPVNFSAQDSLVMTGNNNMYFFGPSHVDYQTMSIEANYMKVNADSSEVYAQYVLDSLGRPTAKPQFADGDQKFESTTMKYNFKTGQGYITDVTTQQGEGYLTSTETKRLKDNTMFLKNGRYTTCDNHDHPHFYINLTKAKAKPNDKIVTGPAYLVIADVPLYLIGLPFGFFPFNEKQTSGILMPSYGIDQNRGLYLTNGGLYLNINDYFDLTLRGDIYTNGSWGINAASNYRRRYKFNGSITASYISTVQGDKAIPSTYSRSHDISLRWTHSQDPKADPLRNFSASVNFSTSSYNRNSTQGIYNPQTRAENTKGSSISYRRSFVGLPLSLTAAFNIDQRSRDSTISVTLPNLSLSLSTVYPFKQKSRVGKERWYEKISMSYSGTLRNSITTKENLILRSNLIKDWRNGMQHSIPISASFDLFNYIKVSPSVNYTAYWYTSRVSKQFDPAKNQIVDADTTYGFYHLNNFSAALSMSTTLYGFFKPWSIFGDKVQMIRHRFTPTISLGYSPDFGTPFWGYYKTLRYQDAQGIPHEQTYSPYDRGIFGHPGRGTNGSINFSFDNNVEMKIKRSLKDSVDTDKDLFRKISLIDQLGIRFSYNMAADSFRWSNISTNIAIRLSQSFTLRLAGDFDPYVWDYYTDAEGEVHPYRIDKLRMLSGKGLGAFLGTGTSINYTFTPDTFKKLGNWFDKTFGRGDRTPPTPEKDQAPDSPTAPRSMQMRQTPSEGGVRGSENYIEDSYDDAGYLRYDIPWSFSFNYSVNVAQDRNKFNTHRREFDYKFTQNLSFRGQIQPTPNWHFSFDANYNFDLKKLTSMTINISRDLHCWTLTASVIPIGPYKSYNMVIGVNSQLLKDLKWEQHSLPTYGGNNWY